MAKKPADLDHPYGHGRVELAGSVVVAAMLLLAAWLIGVESIDKLKNPNQGELKWYTAVAAAASIVVKEGLYWYTYIVGKKINSPVIIANAWHHRTDAIPRRSSLWSARWSASSGSGRTPTPLPDWPLP